MPKITVKLPTLHPGQVTAYKLKEDARGGSWDQNSGGRFKAFRCGRRWGKTDFGKTWIGDGATKGFPMGWFAPGYKYISEAYEEIATMLEPAISHRSKTDGVIRLKTGGRIDFWTLEDERAGRSRMYKRVFVDEGAFTKSNMLTIWENSIKPTLLDLSGSAIVASNTNGVDPENFLYAICNDPKHGFIEYHAPSWSNPFVPRRLPGEELDVWLGRQQAEYDKLRARSHPLAFAQEYGADFVDWSGVGLFDFDKLLVIGPNDTRVPVEMPTHCDGVYAVMDTSTKTGKDNDGTAVTWFSVASYQESPVCILDWDYQQIEGASLEDWLPSIFAIGEQYARDCRARSGFLGVWIEDKDSGQILLQQARRRELNVHAIDSPLTALGKDERALNVSGYHYTGKAKISRHAHDKVLQYKGTSRNHLVSQITGFKVGDKDAAKRADDLLDTYTYGLAIGLGDSEGF